MGCEAIVLVLASVHMVQGNWGSLLTPAQLALNIRDCPVTVCAHGQHVQFVPTQAWRATACSASAAEHAAQQCCAAHRDLRWLKEAVPALSRAMAAQDSTEQPPAVLTSARTHKRAVSLCAHHNAVEQLFLDQHKCS
jgi:hypothetical protein